MTTIAEPITKRPRREQTRQRLLDAALGVLARNGYDRATVDEIVREAGFSKGAFYVHFESKDDLFWAMLEERITRQMESFRAELDPERPVVHNLAAILQAAYSLNRDDPLSSALFMEFVAHAARNDKVRERLAALYRGWRAFAIEILSAGQEAGLVRKGADLEFMASVLIAVIEGTIMQSRLAPEEFRLESTVGPLSRLLAEWLAP
ncbi:MAG: TetR/AcrR family transcriptional regulator [Gammaproteobacteria bacterium]